VRCHIFVKRGEFRRYDDLHKAFAADGPTEVTWDRRLRDRRKASLSANDEERRHTERRLPVPPSWVGLGFVVAGPPKG
jgi:hypothetical protein